MSQLIKERGLDIRTKMDAINVQGVWLNFPGVAAGGRFHAAAGLYLQMLLEEEEERLRRKKKKIKIKETPKQMWIRLMKQVESRIQKQDEDDLSIIMALI